MGKKKSKCGCFSFWSLFSSKKKAQIDSHPSHSEPNPLNLESQHSNHSEKADKNHKIEKKIDVQSKLTDDEVKVKTFPL